jgi:CRISPR-associated protein Cmr6
MVNVNVPENARALVEGALLRNQANHLGLLFYRYLYEKDRGDRTPGGQLNEIVKRARFDTLDFCRARLNCLCRSLGEQGYAAVQIEATASNRVAPGLGISSPFENGISLHRIHGFPYIPGSTLKGIAQDYARINAGITQTDLRFLSVFGTQTPAERSKGFKPHRGSVIFFDAIPLQNTCILDIDVVTPHYKDYYDSRGKIAPADYLSPNPVQFLVISSGTRFVFSLAACDFSSDGEAGYRPARDVLKDACEWLVGALATRGAGGKTFAAGYGRFIDFNDHS